jgi:hypothetical protein
MELRSIAVERLERATPPAEPAMRPPTNDGNSSVVTQHVSELDPALHHVLACPWCESPRVERVGAIGSHLMVSQYICLACRSPFEVIRR